MSRHSCVLVEKIYKFQRKLLLIRRNISVMHALFVSELIRNRTLDFLSKTLPVLKADDTLPKVTQISDDPVNVIDNNG